MATDRPIPDYQRRVIEEHNELEARIGRLQIFLGNVELARRREPSMTIQRYGEDIPLAELVRLRCQLAAMTLYADILAQRVAAFADA
jgi:hypothetical protein